MNRHTFNANSEMLGDTSRFFWAVNHWKPDHLFMMGSEQGPNHNVYAAIDTLRQWNGTVHYRPYSNQEGHLYRVRSPRDYVMMLKRYGRPEIIYNVGNEPIPGQADAQMLAQRIIRASAFGAPQGLIQRLVGWFKDVLNRSRREEKELIAQSMGMSTWYRELFRIAREEGVKVSAPGFATAAYTRDQLPWFDTMFSAIVEYGAWLNVHTYGHALFPWHAAGRDPNDLIHPSRVQRNRWPTKEEIFSNLDWNYLVLREEQIVDRIRVLTGKTPDVVITECFLDRMPNIEVQFRQLSDQIDSIAGGKVYGAPTLYNYWRYLFPQWSPQQTLWEQMNWAEEVYPAHYKAFCWFTWSTHDAHPHYWSSRYGWQHDTVLLEGWPAARRLQAPSPQPQPQPEPKEPIMAVKARALKERNFREEPRLGAKLLGTLRPGDVFWVYENVRALADGFTWIKIEATDAEGVAREAWTAMTEGLYEVIDEPLPDPGEIDLRDYVRKDEFEELIREFFRAL